MKLLVASDLHLEFHADGGRGFLRRLDPGSADAIVVAGDLCTARVLPAVLRELCDRFPHVVYVTGNHEYYGSDPDEVHRILASVQTELPGLHWLHETEAVIEGVRFGGTTLWFRNDPDNDLFAHTLNDFFQIRGFRPWVYEANARALRFLGQRTRELDVIVTHHLPATGSMDARFAGSPMNRFFLCDIGEVIEAGRPPLWVHGHTHASCDYRLGRTRVVCNPAGYNGENVDFREQMTIEARPREREQGGTG